MLSVNCFRSLVPACLALCALAGALPVSAAPAAAPRQVRIKLTSAVVSDSDLQTSGVGFSQIVLTMPAAQKISLASVNGAPALSYLQTLTKAGSVSTTQSVTTADDVKASFNLSANVPAGQAASTAFAVTPHINSNSTLTLTLFPVFTVGTVTHPLSTVLTLVNGSTLVLVLPCANPATGEGNTLLFVTSTVK